MKPRLYIESTIPGYLTARGSADSRGKSWIESTKDFWTNWLPHYDAFISDAVLDEVSRGDQEMAAKRLEALTCTELLQEAPEVHALASHLVTVRIIPAHVLDDAMHIAYAAVYSCDFLLTWNLKHIHNPQIYRRLEAACRGFGYVPPVIVTPDELLAIHSHEEPL